MRITSLPLLFVSVALLLSSCSTKIRVVSTKHYPALADRNEVFVYSEIAKVPVDVEKIGMVKIGDSGFTTDCSYETVVSQAQTEAAKMGGNAIHIVEHRLPGIWGSSCHQIVADVLRINTLIAVSSAGRDSLNPDTAVAATARRVAFYRALPIAPVYAPFRLAINAGRGCQTAKTPEGRSKEETDYNAGMKWGTVLDAEASYFFKEDMGIGVQYLGFYTSNALSNVMLTDNEGNTTQGDISNRVWVTLIAPTFDCRIIDPSRKNILNASIGVGYLALRNESRIVGYKATQTGSRVGMTLGVSYDRMISKTMAIGCKLSSLTGVLTSYTVDEGGTKTVYDIDDSKNYIGLGRVDFTVGLRFNLGKAR